MKLRTKILSFAMAATMLTSVVAGAASTTWVFDGYDLNSKPNYFKVYKELDEKGYPTGRWEYRGEANKKELVHAYYELKWPHAQVGQLYLDGVAQDRWDYTGAEAARLEEARPAYWEAYAPYAVYGVRYSCVPGLIDWAPITWDDNITPRFIDFMYNANVTKDWVKYGQSAYRTINGAFVDSANFLATEIGAGKFQFSNNYADVMNSYAAIKNLDLNNPASPYYGMTALPAKTNLVWTSAVTGKDVVNALPKVNQEELTGPKFEAGKEVGTVKIRALDELMAQAGKGNSFNKALLTSEYEFAPVEWRYAGYENEIHHRIYEYLVIDGVVMDGGDCLQLLYDPCYKGQNWYLAPAKKPLIKRYTGGVAAPYLY